MSAQSDISREYQVKAIFIYNFCHFVEWKSESFSDPSAPFIIGIFGEDPFGKYLDEAVQGEKINGHPIKIYRFKNIKDMHNCNILYINSDSRLLKEYLALTSGKKVL
ncbi:MAG TPA: YfiR family protein, partial [Saprospiraceae bacterium]|nr:YfiR family protein [Saprospiraceae bacterium]